MSSDQPATGPSESPGQTSSEGLLRSSGVTGSMTLISRVLGLVRDIVIARLFGTTDATDAFFLANKIPNFMRRLFAEGAFSQAFVPILSEYRSQKPLEAGSEPDWRDRCKSRWFSIHHHADGCDRSALSGGSDCVRIYG